MDSYLYSSIPFLVAEHFVFRSRKKDFKTYNTFFPNVRMLLMYVS